VNNEHQEQGVKARHSWRETEQCRYWCSGSL